MAPLLQETHFSSHDDGNGIESVFDKKATPLCEHRVETTTRTTTTTAAANTPNSQSIHQHRVSFAATVIVHEVMSIHDYTEDELEASWFDAEELRTIKDRSRSEACLLDWGHFYAANHPWESPRGLETRTQTGIRRKRRNRMDAYEAVFGEIEFLCEQGRASEAVNLPYENAIADAYFGISEACAVAARLLGREDEVEAQEIYQNADKNDYDNRCQHHT